MGAGGGGRSIRHKRKVFKKSIRKDIHVAKHRFGNRGTNEWNMPSSSVVEATSVDLSDRQLDHYLGDIRDIY